MQITEDCSQKFHFFFGQSIAANVAPPNTTWFIASYHWFTIIGLCTRATKSSKTSINLLKNSCLINMYTNINKYIYIYVYIYYMCVCERVRERGRENVVKTPSNILKILLQGGTLWYRGGWRTCVTYFAEEGVFFKTSACPQFCKRRVRSMGVKIPLQSMKYTRL